MSTILKVAQELEREGALLTPPPGTQVTRPRRPLVGYLAAMLVALAAGALGVMLVLYQRGASKPVPVATGEVVSSAEPGSVAGGEPAPGNSRTLAEPTGAAADLPEAPRQPVAGTRHASAPRLPLPETRRPSADVARPVVRRIDPPAPPPKAVRQEVKKQGTSSAPPSAGSLPGEPALQVKSIVYSPNRHGRSVTLQLGGRGVVLREGESAGGLEVQLILPDAVYLRKGGNIVALNLPGRK